MKQPTCLFCQREQITFVLENDLAGAFWDRYPVSTGHLLIIPKTHRDNYFDLTTPELVAVNNLLHEAKLLLDHDFHPDGYNIGVNIEPAAGQTVMHAHVHVIPRYSGDDPHPAGGIRKMFPGGGEFN
ncbi:HIT family protein [Periweissella fabaria]|uniref:Protein hit n=1 Tax=Periweissella fabaria TaxID=546157 RepID=A0ABM8Z426_9LACO|nr:HIT family protein [Periweissella fabaria]MCM0597452.1 HIT family protein [Periweissella fabaria]CAH0416043.1 Protein hit [Periweissella fabaria]